MGTTEIAILLVVGVVAGTVNVLAGAGSLLTYPLLVAVGLPPLAANVTNDIGVVPGNVSGLLGVRRELRGQSRLLLTLVPRAVVGSLVGGALLLLFPGSAFAWVAPPLLFVASLLTLMQPLVVRVSARHERHGRQALHRTIEAGSLYGGYFGTGIGLVFVAALGAFVAETPARLNAVKMVLQLVTNGLAGILFAFVAPVHWPVAAVLAAGTLTGGQLGALGARRVSPATLRAFIAVVGLGASVWLFVHQLI